MRNLRPHQVDGIAMLRHSLATGHRRPMLSAPTGAGKTLLSAAIVDMALRKGNRVTFVVPALSLVDQTVRAFWAEGIRDVGVIQGRHELTDWSKPVQVASVQTLMRRRLPECGLVIVDEAHIWFDFIGQWMAKPGWEKVPFIGLSATPWTKGLGKHYDDLIVVTTTGDLIDKGYLSPFRVFAPNHPDLSGVRTVAGDFHEGELAERMNQPVLVADAVENWLRHGEDRPTLCFAVDRAHARRLQEQFQAAGVSAGYIDAYTSAEERDDIAKAFKRGTVRVVCNVGCLTAGIDWDVRCVVLCRPTKSEMLFVQIIGRGLRTADGKLDCVVFDHSDTHARLGFVTDIHHDVLDDGRERQKQQSRAKPLPKECPECKFLRPAKVSTCPACGFKPTRQCEVEHEEGELLELGAGHAQQARLARAEQQRWFSGLLGVAAARGYKPGWAAQKFKAKWAHWPDNLAKRPDTPGPDILNWVKSEQIRYALGQGKRRAAA